MNTSFFLESRDTLPVDLHLTCLVDELKNLEERAFPIIFSSISDELSEVLTTGALKFKIIEFNKLDNYNNSDLFFKCGLVDTYGHDTQFTINIRINEKDQIKHFKKKLALAILEFLSVRGNRFMFRINYGQYDGSIGLLEKSKLNLGYHKLSYRVITTPLPSKKNITYVGNNESDTKLVITRKKIKDFYDVKGNKVSIGDLIVTGEWFLPVAVIVDVDPVTNCLVIQAESYPEKRLLDEKINFLSLEHIDIKEIKNNILMDKLSS